MTSLGRCRTIVVVAEGRMLATSRILPSSLSPISLKDAALGIWQTFLENTGRLLELLLPKRKIRRVGYSVSSVSEGLETWSKRSLSNVKLGGNKLMINVALFARENGEAKSSKVLGGGVKSAIGGQYKEQVGKPSVNWSNSVKKGVSFLDILTNKSHSACDEDVVVIDPSAFSLSNLTGRAAVGRALGFNELRILKSSLSAAGFEDASLQYLGDLSVLISFKDGDSVTNLIEDKDVWKSWLSSLNPWIGQPLPYERVAWISILGVPPHLVSREVFDAIGNRYGKVIQPSQFLDSDGDLTYDRLGILVDTGNRINGAITLSWQDKRYKVWVVEDNDQWVPEFLEDEEE
ncbi:hypothetical protein HanPI659440_Chr15g0584991 [Helianthus annuus]|nr:hypothetical protein HanPI659440_Chr15g0584991 [Helianthus annuus]